MVFIIDAFNREIIAFTVLSGSEVSGSDIRDLMLEAVETRFGAVKAPKPVKHLSDNGAPMSPGRPKPSQRPSTSSPASRRS